MHETLEKSWYGWFRAILDVWGPREGRETWIEITWPFWED